MHIPANNENLAPQGGPWSVSNSGKLLFKGVEHDISRVNLLKKTASIEDVKRVAAKLNRDYSAGITTQKRIKVGGFFGKRFSVIPNLVFAKSLQLSTKHNISPQIIELARPLVTSKQNEKALVELSQAIAALGADAEQRDEIIALATPWLANCNDEDKASMLYAIANLPRDVVNAAAPFVQKEAQYKDKLQMLDVIGKLPANERAEILQHATPFMNRQHGIAQKIEVLQAVAELPKELRQETLRRVQVVQKQLTQLSGFKDLLQKVAGLSAENFQKLQEHVVPFLKDKGINQESMLDSMCKMPLADIEGVIRDAKPLLNLKGSSNIEKMAFIEAVAKMPPEHRAEIVGLLKPVIEHLGNNLDRMLILHVATELPKAEMLEILKIAMPLAEGYSSAGVNSIIHTIQAEPAETRQAVVEAAMPLLLTAEHAGHIEQYLLTVRDLNPNDRDEVVAIALSLFPDHGLPIVSMLQRLEDLGADRERVLGLAAPLFNQFTSAWDRRPILMALTQIRSSDITQNFIDQIRPLLAQGLGAGAVADAMRRLADEGRLEMDVAETGSIKFSITREQLENSPLDLLDQLIANLHQNPARQLSIEIVGEPGIDASGLGREFVAKVVQGAIKQLKLELPKNGLIREMPGHEKVANQLGELMMFCLNARREYPIGMFFDHSVFVMLSKLQPYHFDQPLTELDNDEKKVQELVDMYVGMNEMSDDTSVQKNIERIRQFATPFTEETDVAILKDLYISAACEYDDVYGLDAIADEVEANPAILKEHLESLQKVAREFVREAVQSSLIFARELAKGMKASPFNAEGDVSFEKAQKMTPKALGVKIQGELDTDIVLKKLQFDFTIPDHKKQWLEDWIKAADLEKLQKFVFALTGAYAVGQLNLKMHNAGENINFHTCFNSVDLPFQSIEDKDLFIAVMEGALAKQEKYSRS